MNQRLTILNAAFGNLFSTFTILFSTFGKIYRTFVAKNVENSASVRDFYYFRTFSEKFSAYKHTHIHQLQITRFQLES